MGKAAIPEYLVPAAFHLERWLTQAYARPLQVVMDSYREDEFRVVKNTIRFRYKPLDLYEPIAVEDFFVCLQAGVFNHPCKALVASVGHDPIFTLRIIAEGVRHARGDTPNAHKIECQPNGDIHAHAPVNLINPQPRRQGRITFTGPCPDAQRLAGRFPAPDPRSYGP